MVLVVTTVCIQPACKKDHGDPPAIPPSSSFVMSFNELDSSVTGQKHFDVKDTTYSNFLFSAGNVFVWNVIITVGLAVPVASFWNAFNYQAEWNKKSKDWVWEYGFTAGANYTAVLHAKVSGSQVHWEMYISKALGFQNFLWYTGDSNFEGTDSGSWTLYDNPTNHTELLGVTWHKNISNATSDIKYLNIVPGGAENGGYISYAISTDTTYNASYNIFNKGQNNLTEIKWSQAHKNGAVKDPAHFGNTNWHYWGTDYKNL